MHASKIQDQIGWVVGTYLGPKKGKYKKDDFIIETSRGPIKLLGITDLANKLKLFSVGSRIKVRYKETITLSNGNEFIKVDVEADHG